MQVQAFDIAVTKSLVAVACSGSQIQLLTAKTLGKKVCPPEHPQGIFWGASDRNKTVLFDL